jgi:hypothetical protein
MRKRGKITIARRKSRHKIGNLNDPIRVAHHRRRIVNYKMYFILTTIQKSIN